MDTIICRDIYVRRTEINGTTTSVSCHRVWDAKRFIEMLQGEANDVNRCAAVRGTVLHAKYEQITEDQYRKERR